MRIDFAVWAARIEPKFYVIHFVKKEKCMFRELHCAHHKIGIRKHSGITLFWFDGGDFDEKRLGT